MSKGKAGRRPDWQLYERLVARLMVNQIGVDVCVTPNAKIRGLISGVSRQIDVLIDARHEADRSRRVVVDAKRRQRKIDVKDVEEFEGMMRDVGAVHGYLVAPSGKTKAAERRAQDLITISIVPLEHVEQIDPMKWPVCLGGKCSDGRVFWDGFPEIWMDLVPVNAISSQLRVPERRAWIYYVGKCDCCGRFHVHCRTCGDLLSFDDDDGEFRCACNTPWFWLVSIECDESGERSAELHLVTLLADDIRTVTVDRRPYAGARAQRQPR